MIKNEIKIFLTSIMFYTRIPCPSFIDHSEEYLNKATRYFPLVGTIVGALSFFSFWLTNLIFNEQIRFVYVGNFFVHQCQRLKNFKNVKFDVQQQLVTVTVPKPTLDDLQAMEDQVASLTRSSINSLVKINNAKSTYGKVLRIGDYCFR
mgnify:CR=1 FL=1